MTMHVKGVGLKFPDGTEQSTAAVGGSGPDTGLSGVYTKEETDAKLAGKANVGVSYTKGEADNIVDDKADIGVSYTKTETEARLATKADVEDLSKAIPTGMIMLWSGSVASIPVGWALCNGTNGTPQLTNRFIVGAGGSLYNPANTGGSANAENIDHTHTASMNATGHHSHTLSGSTNTTGNHAHSIATASGKGNYQTSGYSATCYTSTAAAATNTTGNHAHSV
jgi:hypothetical protein